MTVYIQQIHLLNDLIINNFYRKLKSKNKFKENHF